MARILILSDITTWAGCKDLVSFHKPEVVLLAGDLTSDGFATFWRDAFKQIPAFVRGREALARRYGVRMIADGTFSVTNEAKWRQFSVKLDALENAYRDSPEYDAARRMLHVEPFYDFLRFAGKTSSVLVVKGDHDDDFAGDYDTQRINRIRGCREISGDIVTIHGLRFLGLGFKETHFKRTLLDFVNSFKGKVDVVVAHSEQSQIPLIGEIEPRLLARGHFGHGRYFVNGVPSVFTGGPFYSVANLGRALRITQYRRPYHSERKMTRPRRYDGADCRPLFSTSSEFDVYGWLKPYCPDKRTRRTRKLSLRRGR